MLSDSPPERDVIWTEAGVAGAGRFMQRVWRLVDEIAETRRPQGSRAAGSLRTGGARSCAAPPTRRSSSVGRNIEGLRFNVAVASIYEFTNALSAASAKVR